MLHADCVYKIYNTEQVFNLTNRKPSSLFHNFISNNWYSYIITS